MPLMIGYQLIATAVSKTEDQVRDDKKNGLVDIDSLDSVVDYIARGRGWVPIAEIDVAVAAKTAALAAAAPAAPVAPVAQPKQYAGTSTVKDNVKPTDDPYLARVQRARDGRA